ncbi:hypothetical protein Ddc_10942 [Ditylenchus destructor]|nr:hypothetical protein Ddc_10942 [Ditylenchus destructor]
MALVYLSYLTCGQAIVMLISRLTCLYTISRLMWVRRSLKSLSTNLSHCMFVYLTFSWIMALVSIPNHLYVVINMITCENYAPYTIYWLGLWPNVCYGAITVPVVFISLERCLAIRLAARYSSQVFIIVIKRCCGIHLFQVQIRLMITDILLLSIVFMVCLLFFLLELPLDTSTGLTCTNAPCLSRKFRALQIAIPKVLLSGMSVAVSSLFLFFMGNIDFKLTRNRMVKYTVILDFLMNVVPIYSSLAYYLVTHVSSTVYFGEYSLTLNAIESAILSLYYYRVLLLRRKSRTFERVAASAIIINKVRIANFT